jgi:hypothetical protein
MPVYCALLHLIISLSLSESPILTVLFMGFGSNSFIFTGRSAVTQAEALAVERVIIERIAPYAEQQVTRGIVQTKGAAEEAQAINGRQRRVCAEVIECGINLVRWAGWGPTPCR